MSSSQEFIAQLKAPAIDLYRRTGILPSISISQAALESGWGSSGLTKKNNNLFGIKGKGSTYQTTEYVNGKPITVQANFKSYSSIADSLADYGDLLAKNSRYSGVVSAGDYASAADALGRSGYATDPSYAGKIKNIVQTFGLDSIDREAQSGGGILDLLGLGKITSPFGDRKAPTPGASTKHNGIDIVLKNENVPSIFDGFVTERGYNTSRGNYVTIAAGDGTQATYQHLASPVSMAKGDIVNKGQTIGIMGNTGVSTGKHLHLEVKKNGQYIDPLSLSHIPGNVQQNGGIQNMNFSITNPIEKIWGDITGGFASFTRNAILIICGLVLLFFGVQLLFGSDTTISLGGK